MLVVHSGLELPTYTEDEVAWTKGEIIDAAQSDQPDFVRRTCLEYDGPVKDLSTVLTMADMVLAQICTYMGVEKAQYSWGLAPVSEATRDRLGENNPSTHPLLPAGYGLVARVENVIGARALTPYWEDRIAEWSPSGIGLICDDGQFVTNKDLRSDQFVMHSEGQGNEMVGSAVIVDIEPRLASKVWE